MSACRSVVSDLKHAHFSDPPEIRSRFLQLAKDKVLDTIKFSTNPLRVHFEPEGVVEALISVNTVNVAFSSQEEIVEVLAAAPGPEVTLQLLPVTNQSEEHASFLSGHESALIPSMEGVDEWGFVQNDTMNTVCPLCLLQRPPPAPPPTQSHEDADSCDEGNDGPPQMCTQHQYRTQPSDGQCAIERRESWRTFMQHTNTALADTVFILSHETSAQFYQAPMAQVPVSDEFLVGLCVMMFLKPSGSSRMECRMSFARSCGCAVVGALVGVQRARYPTNK